MKCEYKPDILCSCDKDATEIAYNPKTLKVEHVCSYHSEIIADMGDHAEHCPNCGCVIPTYE